MNKTGKLHVLTDTSLQSRFTHAELARLAILGGADTIQLRDKTASTRELIEIALRMKEICSSLGIPLIVNDRLDVALASQADGVHLGQDDFPLRLARQILGPDVIIGGSAAVLEQARTCLDEGADYVGFGPVFPTSSKEDAGTVSGIHILKRVVETVPLPIVAIGGITINNIKEVMQAGAKGIAVISAVCCQKDPEEATRKLAQALRETNRG